MGTDRGASLNKLLSSKHVLFQQLPLRSQGLQRDSGYSRSHSSSPEPEAQKKEGSEGAGKQGSEQERSHLTHPHLVPGSPALDLVQQLSLCASTEKSTPTPPPTPWCRECYADRLTNTICLTVAFDSLPPVYNSLRWSKVR